MARITLIDPGGRAATTIEAVLGRVHDLVVRSRIHAPADSDLVIADLRHAELADHASLRSLTSFGPVLLLVDRKEPIPPTVQETGELAVLRKPFDPFELRLRVDQLLREASCAPDERLQMRPSDAEDSAWLEFPFVSAPAGAVLRRAARLWSPLWILGEPGSGRQRIAIAVCRKSTPPLRAVTLFPDERLDQVLEREHGDEPYALLVPDIEQRSRLEQERLAASLAGSPGFRLIATSQDDPAAGVVDGTFSRKLYRYLVGLAVQISPLREQPLAIPPLVQALTRRLVRRLGGVGDVSFSHDAMARLQTYMWPGNVVELEAVLTRTLTFIAESDLSGRTIEANELLFTPEDAVRPRAQGRSKGRSGGRDDEPVARIGRPAASDEGRTAQEARGESGASRPELLRPVPTVVEKPAGASDSTDSETERQAEVVRAEADAEGGEAATPAPSPLSFETVLAGLAHDLRNPMVTIKTFAGAISADGPDSESTRELGALAGEACQRLDGYLEALGQYAAFRTPEPRLVEFIAALQRAIAERGAADRITVEAERPVETHFDPAQLAFVIDNILEAAFAELAAGAKVRVTAIDTRTVRFDVPTGGGPVSKLRRLVGPGDKVPSWRLLLATAVARRNGSVVDVDVEGETMTIRCSLLARQRGEEGSRGEQTNRFNR